MISSTDAEKKYDKIQYRFRRKKNNRLNKLGIEENYINIMKPIYKKHTVKLILNNEY